MIKLPFTPKAVIFDMDGIITDTMGYHYDAWKKAFKAYGIDVDYYDIYLREGQKGIQTAIEMLKENNLDPVDKKPEDILTLKEEIFKKISKPRLMKGADKLVKDLKNAGYILALVTGTSRDELNKILPDDIIACFDFSVSGDEVSCGKPHPEPFTTALNKLSLKPEEAVVLENAPFGIISARQAGLFVIAVTTYLPEKHLKKADIILKSLEEADKLLLNQQLDKA